MPLYVLRGVVADKTNAELFTIETSGADVTEESQSHKRIWKPLKCQANLVNQSKTEPVVGRKPKSLKNRIKRKTRILSKEKSSSIKQCSDSAKDSSVICNTQQHPQQLYNLWSTGEVLLCTCIYIKCIYKILMVLYMYRGPKECIVIYLAPIVCNIAVH